VEADIRQCPDGRRQHEPGGREHPGSQRHGDEVAPRGPNQVLLHLPVARPGQLDHRPRVVSGQIPAPGRMRRQRPRSADRDTAWVTSG
jgi:hypothetical protein